MSDDDNRPRAKDGRFVPETGKELPPRKQQPRDEKGHFIPLERVQSSKPYSRAVRELFDAKEQSIPDGWDHKNLTEAQALAMVHMAQAKSGNVQLGMVLIDRAEGKVPQAAEDREAAVAAGTGIKLLANLLGLDMTPVMDVEIVPLLGESSSEARTSDSKPDDVGSTPASPAIELDPTKEPS